MDFNLTKIGYISKAHGFKGDVKVVLDVAYLGTNFPEFIWIYIDGKPVPFFVEKWNPLASQFILKFEDVNDEAASNNYKNRSIYCESKIFENYFEKEDSLDDLIGFDVSDEKQGAIGYVSGIIENSVQPTLVVSFQEKEILIPYNEDIVLEVDEVQKRININAPDGLIALYLE